MHIPDGFISPSTSIVALVLAIPAWQYGIKKTKELLDSNEDAVTFLSSMAAFSFLIMMINIPIPGGTSGHAVGMGVLAILLGPWTAFIAISAVLFFQAVLFGDGGILAIGANSLAMGFVGSFGSYYFYRLLHNRASEDITLFVSGYGGMVLSSVAVALILGIQPVLFMEDGKAIYFPFGLNVTIPAITGSHMLIFGVIEGLVTVAVVRFFKKIKRVVSA
ncbi:MAG: cobalt transporter CbiM [Sulfurovaceae bacterium]